MNDQYNIEVSVETTYVAEHSEPEEDRFVFAYTITLVNRGSVSAQLLSRHWIITASDIQVAEGRGEGVVGAPPVVPLLLLPLVELSSTSMCVCTELLPRREPPRRDPAAGAAGVSTDPGPFCCCGCCYSSSCCWE